MLKHVYTASVLALITFATSVDAQDPALVGFDWEVTFCTSANASSPCTDVRKPKPGSRLGIHFKDGLQFRFSTPVPEGFLRLAGRSLDFDLDENPPRVAITFLDYGEDGNEEMKTAIISALHIDGAPEGEELNECVEYLRQRFGQGFSETQAQSECERDSLVYWQILPGDHTTFVEVDWGEIQPYGPPGSGHGTGSDGGGQSN
ncbi:hypothetical protein [Wenzhouxiangella sp. EGI_FJ10409]|uniref:hypothetical protein n=1 Tax=Wenzhouxiangella sp. EGI_FJ10409 TaxID=3243767 RepID=UPI0035E100F4